MKGTPAHCLVIAAVSIAAACVSGCTIHTATADRFVGPTLTRVTNGDARVCESISPVLAVEFGGTNGLTIGFLSRTTVAPADPNATPADRVLPIPLPGGWTASLLYSRVDAPHEALMVRRGRLGAGLAFGAEAQSGFIGWSSTSIVRPPPDVYYVIDFDSANPERTRCAVWNSNADPEKVLLFSKWGVNQ